MLKLAQTKEELSIIHDQVGVPTGAALIADVTAQAIRYYTLQSETENKICMVIIIWRQKVKLHGMITLNLFLHMHDIQGKF